MLSRVVTLCNRAQFKPGQDNVPVAKVGHFGGHRPYMGLGGPWGPQMGLEVSYRDQETYRSPIWGWEVLRDHRWCWERYLWARSSPTGDFYGAVSPTRLSPAPAA